MDHISKLPDDILVNILSRLTIEEAARTSILSNRWRYLWTYFTGSLDFIDPYITRHLAICSDPYYVFEDEDSDYDVGHWVQFAIEKRVQRLELDFSQEGRIDHELHVFLPRFETSSSFSSLVSLRLSDVDIPEKVLEFLLWNCPLLEVLRLKGAESLVSVDVSAPSLKLKYLELRDLPNLDKLEIDAANLESFGYCGRELNVFFKHVPSLTEMSIEGDYCTYTLYNLHPLSSFLAQLSTLKLNLETVTVPEDVLNSIPKLPNLKHLEMTISTADIDCFHTCVAFLKASPFLHEFTLKVFLVVEPCRYIPNIKDHPLSNLRSVSFIGFSGREADIKFLKDLLENAVMLEKIIIDPCKLNFMGNVVEWSYRSSKSYKSARKCAIELAEKFPHLEFVIPEIFTPAAR